MNKKKIKISGFPKLNGIHKDTLFLSMFYEAVLLSLLEHKQIDKFQYSYCIEKAKRGHGI